MTLREAAARLAAAGIEDAASEARLLAAHYTGRSEASLLAARDEPLGDCPALEAALCRRARREPLQYILGRWTFFGLPFFVSPGCLIPRPETELLVEAALAALPAGARVADLCTGSGCVGIALAKTRPDVTVTAVELSDAARAIARKNADALGVADRFAVRAGDVTGPVFAQTEIFDAMVANPPYVASDEMKTLAPELAWEPAMALTDGGDGLRVIAGVLDCAARSLRAGGRLWMEIGAGQGGAVRALCAARPLTDVRILEDLAGHERVVCARRAGNREDEKQKE